MKKLSIILLALAFAVSFAGTALAFHNGDEGTSEGAIGITGKYTLDAESYKGQSPTETAWYDDDMEVVIRLNMGSVTGVIDLEPTDDENFEGSGKARSGDLIDNYYVMWNTPVDGLATKIGEYGLSFGKKVVIYADPAAHTIGLTYGLEGVDLGFYISKVDETKTNDDNDNDALTLTANVKSVEFFKKLNFIYLSGTDDVGGADESYGYMGLEAAFEAGPVDVALEYGATSDDVTADETNFMWANFGLNRLIGYGLYVEYFSSDEDGDLEARYGAGDYYPLMIFGFRGGFGDLNDTNLIMVGGSYGISDNTTFKGKVLVSGDQGTNDDDIGTEFDLHLVQKFDDNVSGTFTYASWSAGDVKGSGADTETDMRARFVFTF